MKKCLPSEANKCGMSLQRVLLSSNNTFINQKQYANMLCKYTTMLSENTDNNSPRTIQVQVCFTETIWDFNMIGIVLNINLNCFLK